MDKASQEEQESQTGAERQIAAQRPKASFDDAAPASHTGILVEDRSKSLLLVSPLLQVPLQHSLSFNGRGQSNDLYLCVLYVPRPCRRTDSKASVNKASVAAVNDATGQLCASVWPVHSHPTLGRHIYFHAIPAVAAAFFYRGQSSSGGGDLLPRRECR